MIVYSAQFIKKDGSLRKINFARLQDVQHMLPPTKGGNHKNLSPHQEMVWDMEQKNYRIFNWSSVIGEVTAKREF